MPVVTGAVQDNGRVSCGMLKEPRILPLGNHTPFQGFVGQGFLLVPHQSINLSAFRNYHWVLYILSSANGKDFVTCPFIFPEVRK